MPSSEVHDPYQTFTGIESILKRKLVEKNEYARVSAIHSTTVETAFMA
jgi:hypothetical protein